jgi:hypothetical protein
MPGTETRLTGTGDADAITAPLPQASHPQGRIWSAAHMWVQFAALAPTRSVHHSLGCHRPRIPDRVVFDKLIQILVFGCGYRRVADATCSATTLRRRRDEWIALGLADGCAMRC